MAHDYEMGTWHDDGWSILISSMYRVRPSIYSFLEGPRVPLSHEGVQSTYL